MHSQIYLTIACISVALAAGATYALVTDGGQVTLTTAAAIEAAQSIVPTPLTPSGNESAAKPPAPELPLAVEHLRAQLAQSLGRASSDVTATNVERRTWTDSCFGIGGPTESCAQMYIEGYRVIFSTGFGRYTYRMNLDGSSVRVE